MNYLNRHYFDLGADSQEDAKVSVEAIKQKLEMLNSEIANIDDQSSLELAKKVQQQAELYQQLDETDRAWQLARQTIDRFVEKESWESAVLSCEIMYRSNHEDALIALGHALWLSITYPVDASLTLAQLQYVIDETPSDSDGAAVAAAVAGYVAEIRTQLDHSNDITLAVGQMMHDVSRRHGQVTNEDEFKAWVQRLELDRPEKFLIRMRNIIDVLVQDQWWIDRHALQSKLPENS